MLGVNDLSCRAINDTLTILRARAHTHTHTQTHTRDNTVHLNTIHPSSRAWLNAVAHLDIFCKALAATFLCGHVSEKEEISNSV